MNDYKAQRNDEREEEERDEAQVEEQDEAAHDMRDEERQEGEPDQYADGSPRNPVAAAGVSSQGGSSGDMSKTLAAQAASGLGGRFDIAKLLDAVVKYNGSDLHLRVNRPPCIRVR